MSTPQTALKRLAEFALSAPDSDHTIIYNSVALLAGVINAPEMRDAARKAERAIRVADERQMEFRQILSSIHDEADNGAGLGNGHDGGDQ